MNALLRFGGIILVLIGVAVLAVPYFTNSMTNTLLGTGFVLMVVGIIATIVLNKIELNRISEGK